MEAVAASRLLLAIVQCQMTTSNKVEYSNTNHLLPAMARTLMGVQVTPIPMLALTGMPSEWTMLATWGLFEFWTELQQYCSEAAHWPLSPQLNAMCSQRGGQRWDRNMTYLAGKARAPATKAATIKKVLENIFNIRIIRPVWRMSECG